MYLIQILIPLADNSGVPFSAETLQGIRLELSERFGGLTAYTRAPAKGIWTSGAIEQTDDIVIVEVMTGDIEEDWWRGFRLRLEQLLRQKQLVIRVQDIKLL